MILCPKWNVNEQPNQFDFVVEFRQSVLQLAYFYRGRDRGRPLRQFAPFRDFLPEIWSEYNRKTSITKEICITIDFAPLKKFLDESQTTLPNPLFTKFELGFLAIFHIIVKIHQACHVNSKFRYDVRSFILKLQMRTESSNRNFQYEVLKLCIYKGLVYFDCNNIK